MPAWPESFERILRRRCEHHDPATEIPADVPLSELGVDSLGMLMFILQAEETFGITLPEAVLAGDDLDTPGSAWAAIERLLPGPGAP